MILCMIALLGGCDDTINNEDIDKIQIPTSNVSYSKYIQPVFTIKCNNKGCHNINDRAGNLSLDSHAEATLNSQIVFPGLPDNSKLVWTIERRPTVPIMPPLGYAPLTSNQIAGIKTWIKEGAKSN